MNNNEIRYRSCFIVEVIEQNNIIELIDSTGTYYQVHKDDKRAFDTYLNWFKNLFMSAKSQSLTIITYRMNDLSECEFENKVISLDFNVQ
jgi:hypothetical protein